MGRWYPSSTNGAELPPAFRKDNYDPKVDPKKSQFGKLKNEDETVRVLPIGWQNFPEEGTSISFATVLAKVVGLILTSLAVSLGAPFWFDLLSKFMNVRGTGQSPPGTNQN